MTEREEQNGPSRGASAGPRAWVLLLVVMALGVAVGVLLERVGIERLIRRDVPATRPAKHEPARPVREVPPAAWHVPGRFTLPEAPRDGRATPRGVRARAPLLVPATALDVEDDVPFLLTAAVTREGLPFPCRVRILPAVSPAVHTEPMEVRTGPKGRFSIALGRAGRVIVSLYSNDEGYGTLLYQTVADVPRKGRRVTIALPTGEIAGHVRPGRGELPKNTTVAVWRKLAPGERPLPGGSDAPTGWRRVPGALVGAGGVFRVRHLAPGRHLVRAGAVVSGVYRFSTAAEADLAEGGKLDGVTLALAADHAVTLKVIDQATGGPVDGAAVTLCDEHGITLRDAAVVNGEYAPLVTDRAGVVTFDALPSGAYGARVDKPGYVSAPGSAFRFDVGPGAPSVVTLEKQRAYPARLEVTLLGDEGRAPLGGTLEVIVSNTAGEAVRRWRESVAQWTGDELESGRWTRELDDLAPGTYQADALYRRSEGIPPVLVTATFAAPSYPAPTAPPPETVIVRLRIDPMGSTGDPATLQRLTAAMKVGTPARDGQGDRLLTRNDEPLPLSAPASLLDKPLPALQPMGIERQTQGRRVLVCFLDLSTSPSRIAAKHIAKQAADLRKNGVIVVGVQALPINNKVLELMKWQIDNAFPVAELRGDAELTCFQWGVRELPWLVLTDRAGIVHAEGFPAKALGREVKRLKADELSKRLRETRVD